MSLEALYDDAPRGCDGEEWSARLLLHLAPSVGPARYHALLARFGSASSALSASTRALQELLGSCRAAEGLRDHAGHAARAAGALGAARRLGMRVLLHGDPGYPESLHRMAKCPPALWVRGTLPERPGMAIVGTRRASGRACERAADLAARAVARGLSVVSGGAYGVDAAAHRGALAASGATVVVLGGGLDRPYPERHIPLFEAAVRKGAVVSPFPPGTPPVRGGFLARNGVIASLSGAVTVVEAPHRSGALGTAQMARRLGIPLLAVPGSPGTDALLRLGARVPSAWTSDAEDESGADDALLLADDEQGLALGALAALGEATADAVAARAGLGSLEALAALMALVVEGCVTQEPGGRFRPSPGAASRPVPKKEG